MLKTIENKMIPAMFIGLQIFLLGLGTLKFTAVVDTVRASGNLPGFILNTALLLSSFIAVCGIADYIILKQWIAEHKGKKKR